MPESSEREKLIEELGSIILDGLDLSHARYMEWAEVCSKVGRVLTPERIAKLHAELGGEQAEGADDSTTRLSTGEPAAPCKCGHSKWHHRNRANYQPGPCEHSIFMGGQATTCGCPGYEPEETK